MTTDQYASLVHLIAKKTGSEFGRARAEDLKHLVEFGLPPSVIEFFVAHEPLECVEGAARLLPLARILEENTDCVPGCNIIKHGYVVFSTTYCGDTYCFDLNYQFVDVEPRVILMCCEHDYESMTKCTCLTSWSISRAAAQLF